MSRIEFDGTSYPYTYDIPKTISMDGWKNVPIEESHQPLVPINGIHERIKTHPMYHINGVPNALRDMYLREEAFRQLVEATQFLPPGHSFIVFDAYRPVDVQAEIFNAYKNRLASLYPNIDDEELARMTETYVSLPSTDPTKPSPHSTGGALDLSIIEDGSGLLEMGTEWDSFDVRSRTSYFKGVDDLFHDNRQLLHQAMSSVGFTNYPEEWWHYDFGNQFWGHISGTEAIYGLIEGGDIYDRNTQS